MSEVIVVRAAESVGNVDRYIGIRACDARGQESRKLSGLRRHVIYHGPYAGAREKKVKLKTYIQYLRYQ